MSGRLKHRRLGGQYSRLLVGASCRLSNRVEPMEISQVKMPFASIKGTQTMSPLASPQVVQTGKKPGSQNCRTKDSLRIFPLILGAAKVTAVSVLQGQGGHSSHRGQASCCLPLSVHMKKRPFGGEGKLHIVCTAGTQKPYYDVSTGTQLQIGVKV